MTRTWIDTASDWIAKRFTDGVDEAPFTPAQIVVLRKSFEESFKVLAQALDARLQVLDHIQDRDGTVNGQISRLRDELEIVKVNCKQHVVLSNQNKADTGDSSREAVSSRHAKRKLRRARAKAKYAYSRSQLLTSMLSLRDVEEKEENHIAPSSIHFQCPLGSTTRCDTAITGCSVAKDDLTKRVNVIEGDFFNLVQWLNNSFGDWYGPQTVDSFIGGISGGISSAV